MARGEAATSLVAQAKLVSSQTFFDIATNGMQALGGYAQLPEYHMERYFREAKHGMVGGGTGRDLKIVAMVGPLFALVMMLQDLGLGVEADRLTHLVANVLAYARLERGGIVQLGSRHVRQALHGWLRIQGVVDEKCNGKFRQTQARAQVQHIGRRIRSERRPVIA